MRGPGSASDTLARRILWGLAAGLALGLALRAIIAAAPGTEPGLQWVTREILDPIGQVFLRLLFFVVVPLVFSSLALGVLQLPRLDRLGPLTGRTFLLFAVNMTSGVALGLLMMNLVQPGSQIDEATRDQLLQQYQGGVAAVSTPLRDGGQVSLRGLVEMFMPRNLLRSVVDFQLLPLILFALLCGAAGSQLPGAHRQSALAACEIVSEVMTRLVHYAMRLAPYAVVALLATVVVTAGTGILRPLFVFVVAVLAAMAAHLFGTLSLLLRLLSRRRPAVFFRAVRTVLVTAFSTSSSNATLPTSIQVSREVLGVSPSTAGFVLPLGATMNMSGTAIYEGCVVLFVAQVYGIPLGLGQQTTLLVLAVLSAVAVAGIPGASLPLIVGLMANFGLPAEGIALILGFDRLLDMARTVLNVAADLVTACIVDEQMGGAVPEGVEPGPG